MNKTKEDVIARVSVRLNMVAATVGTLRDELSKATTELDALVVLAKGVVLGDVVSNLNMTVTTLNASNFQPPEHLIAESEPVNPADISRAGAKILQLLSRVGGTGVLSATLPGFVKEPASAVEYACQILEQKKSIVRNGSMIQLTDAGQLQAQVVGAFSLSTEEAAKITDKLLDVAKEANDASSTTDT